MLAEKHCRRRRELVRISSLLEESYRRQIVAQDSDAPLGGSAHVRNALRCACPVLNRREDLEVDGRLQGGGPLMGEGGFEEQFGRGHDRGLLCVRHDFTLYVVWIVLRQSTIACSTSALITCR